MTNQNPPPKRFGDILVEAGLISATQLHQALDFARERDLKIGESLCELGFVNAVEVAKTIGKQLNIPFVDFDKIILDPAVVTIIPEIIARKHKVIAIGKRTGELLVAFADPLNIFAIDEVKTALTDSMIICVAVESKIITAIDRFYTQGQPEGEEISEKVLGEEYATVAAVNDLIAEAVSKDSSDIHIEPLDDQVRVRFRVDGILRGAQTFPMEMHASLISRIKILSQLDIGERRKPQDGRIEINVSGKEFDIRVSTLPLSRGEKVVMRLLEKAKAKISMDKIGLETDQQKTFQAHLQRPHEIILVTGPTGCGKTTTLYTALNSINSIEKNIVTVEDPVEYEISGVNQVQVNPKADLTFASTLRSILRQDPNVIMIGEIRDVETAEIAIQSALTGHLVLSTIHTNDACGAVTRLIDMSIPPFLIASALGLVVAQRLVRQLCKNCREIFVPPAAVQEDLGLEFDQFRIFYQPKGCKLCDNSGYRGRLGIYEILPISQAIESLIMEKASSHELFRQAQEENFLSLRHYGMEKVVAGMTSLDEIMRVTLDARE